MNKLMTVVAASVCAVSLSGSAVAAENTSTEKQDAEALEEEEVAVFEAGFDFDFLSAYVWRNAIQNDEMVMQPCVWADLTCFEPFWLGFSIWQNYDLTDRRHRVLEKGLTETDYNVHAGMTIWESEDGETSLGLEIGHEWYVNQFVRDAVRMSYPDTRELYAKLTFDNPFVNVYGQASWMYAEFGDYKRGGHCEIGFNKEYEIIESVTVGADWNVNFGTANYLHYLWGGTCSGFDAVGEPQYEDRSGGFGGTTVKAYLTWQVTDCLSFGGVIAYTGVLNGAYREALGDQGDYWWDYDEENDVGNGGYQRDFIWGGLQAKLSF